MLARLLVMLLPLLAAPDYFRNPVIRRDWADPTVWYEDGRYYSVATGLDAIYTSTDMVSWSKLDHAPLTRDAMEQARRLSRYLWAPDVEKIGDAWMMYVTCYRSAQESKIVAFRSSSPSGPFEYDAIISDSAQTGIPDTIDPEVVYDPQTARLWLFFGSIGGIHRVALAPDGRRVAEGARYEHVAGLTYEVDSTRTHVFEGSYLHYRRGYWYLFVSCGYFADPQYMLKVGRSPSLDGEFVDKDGRKMSLGYATPLLWSTLVDNFYGPGHNGEIFSDAAGQDYIFYHCHDRSPGTARRFTFLQRLFWDADGWPYLDHSRPLAEDLTPLL